MASCGVPKLSWPYAYIESEASGIEAVCPARKIILASSRARRDESPKISQYRCMYARDEKRENGLSGSAPPRSHRN